MNVYFDVKEKNGKYFQVKRVVTMESLPRRGDLVQLADEVSSEGKFLGKCKVESVVWHVGHQEAGHWVEVLMKRV